MSGLVQMSPEPTRPQDPWQACCQRVCTALVEERWRARPGLALRIGRDAPGVVERPGRTRFDLRWDARSRLCEGLLRARPPQLPLADGSLALLVIDRLGLARAQLLPLLQEALRVLAEDGRVLLIDYCPWGWLGWQQRGPGESRAAGVARQVRWLRALGFEDIETSVALRLPPLPGALLARFGSAFERGFGWPAPPSLQAICASKRASNVIAVPFARDRRRALVAAPEGMRRAG